MRTHILALLTLRAASGFYLPGVAPREYLDGEKVEVKVNKLTSTVTQVRSAHGQRLRRPGGTPGQRRLTRK
jgi:hypothetical protein